jgi:hypothetical protein
VIREIAQFIEDRTHGYFEIGRNLYVGYLPVVDALGAPVIDQLAVVLENVGADVDGQLPDYADKYIQIWNRAKDFWEARDDAYVIYNVLHGATGWDLPVLTSGEDYLAMVIDARSQPAPIAQPDDQGYFVFSTNYVFRIESP